MPKSPRAMVHPDSSAIIRDGQNIDPAGTSIFLNWDRIEQELRRAGTLHNWERVATFVIEDRGIYLRLERKPR